MMSLMGMSSILVGDPPKFPQPTFSKGMVAMVWGIMYEYDGKTWNVVPDINPTSIVAEQGSAR